MMENCILFFKVLVFTCFCTIFHFLTDISGLFLLNLLHYKNCYALKPIQVNYKSGLRLAKNSNLNFT